MKKIDRKVQPGWPHLLAALPYKVEAIELATAKNPFKQGEKLAFSARIKTDGAPAGLHVLRIELTDPDGNIAGMYTSKIKAEDGEFQSSICLALDEKVGEWKITARDIASGASAETTVTVQ